MNNSKEQVLRVAYTSGRKCLYSLVNFFTEIFECIFLKPHVNLFQKWTEIDRLPYHFLSYNHVNINIMPYAENTYIAFLKLIK